MVMRLRSQTKGIPPKGNTTEGIAAPNGVIIVEDKETPNGGARCGCGRGRRGQGEGGCRGRRSEGERKKGWSRGRSGLGWMKKRMHARVTYGFKR